MLKIKKVAVGISGGVDSAIAAFLLKQKGYDVQGVFMQNWDIRDEKGVCSSDADYHDAKLICKKIKIPLHKVNFVKQYWNEVFSYLIKEYESGYTPNPDILCNKNVKFNHFYDYARNYLNADAIATGHYAKSSFGPFLENYTPNTDVKLLHGRDPKKDQVFFLCQIGQKALRKTMFPLGDWLKTDVKQLALKQDFLNIVLKKESMGICFIGKRNFQDFIREYIPDKPGNFINVDNGEIVGKHNGIHQWTLGQRIKLKNQLKAFFTARKDVETNTIYVVPGTNHPLLYSRLCFTEKPHWIHSQPNILKLGGLLKCKFKFQHTQNWVDSTICETAKGLVIYINEFKRAITPGQYAVLSKDGECLGSAKIINAISIFSLYYLQNIQSDKTALLLKEYNIVKNCYSIDRQNDFFEEKGYCVS